MKKIIIAVDGYSACGKSSTAKQVAKNLGYIFIDSGAMYRAATLFFLEQDIDLEDSNAVAKAVDEINIAFSGNSIQLNGVAVDKEIRTPEVNGAVSEVSALSSVRRKMVKQQQEIGRDRGVVMDGRDIGTVVFPNAELKIFMTADVEVRAERRRLELLAKGIDQPTERIIENLIARDRIDSTRVDSPLIKAADAVEIDTTHLTLEDQIFQVTEMANKLIHED